MSTPARVRVTARATREALATGRRPVRAVSGPVHDEAADAARLAVLLRVHRRLALRTMALALSGLFGLPLLLARSPDLTGVTVLGVPVLWWALGVGVYPLLLLVSRRHARLADRLDEELAP